MRAIALLLLISPLCAQSKTTIPEDFRRIPGNYALAMPARWSAGILQTVIDKELIPTSLKGATVTRVRLRRTNYLGTGALAGKTIQLTLQMGPSAFSAAKMWGQVDKNYGKGMVYVAGASAQPASYSIPALPAPGRADAVGEALIDLPLSVPYLFVDQNTLIEWEAMSMPFDVSEGYWVDAVRNIDGLDAGVAVSVGHGGCGPSSATQPMQLDVGAGSRNPKWNATTNVELAGGAAGESLVLSVDFDPLTGDPPIAGSPIWGGTFAAMGFPSCNYWAEPEMALSATTNFLGGATVAVPFPASPGPAFLGRRVGLQAVMVKPAFAASNGVVLVMNKVSVGARAASIIVPELHFPDYPRPAVNPTTMVSDPIWAPWGVMRGTTPVFEFVH